MIRRISGVRSRTRESTNGQALVEFAFISVLLAGLLFLTVDMGRMFWDYNQMRGAVREGAGFGARDATVSCANVATRVNQAVNGGPTAACGALFSAVPQPACVTVGGNGTFTVRWTHTFRPNSLQFLNFFSGSFGGDGDITMPMTASATMRCMT